jgi:LuxR family maltose regulon positive regulatory protein
MMQVELASGQWSLAEQALHAVEGLMQREPFGFYPSLLPTLRTQLWRAQGQVKEAADWAASVVFPEEPWERNLYYAFPVVIRVYFAQQRWAEALALLERFSGHLDRPSNIRITITYLAQLLVALYQTGQRDPARVVAARLFALTEPEGYLRVYLDEGAPMRQALEALLAAEDQGEATAVHPANPRDTAANPLPCSFLVRLLAAFAQEEQQCADRADRSATSTPKSDPSPQTDARQQHGSEPLSRQEMRVLQLLIAGKTYAEMAETLIVSPNTIKTQVSSIYRKLGVRRRAEAIVAARQFHLF